MPSNKSSTSTSGPVDPDADIIPKLVAQDQNAMKILMDRHLATIKSLAWHMLSNDHDAEDVAQEVFLRTWQQAPKWETGNAKLLTWMRRVGTNLCLDRLRKKREVLTDEVPEMEDKAPLASEKMEQKQTSQMIKNAMAQLPERQSAALSLCHFQGLSQKEAAEVLAVSVRAYESLLARARKSLKEYLLEQKGDIASEYGETL